MLRQKSTGETQESHTQRPPLYRVQDDIYYSSREDFVRPLMQMRLRVDLPEQCKFLAASHDGQEWAMFAIGNYVEYDAELFFATTGGRTPIRALTRKMAQYVWDVCGCRRVTTRVDVTNKLALRHNKIFGFVQEGVLRKASPEGHDVIVFGMLKEEYRYGKILEKGNKN